MNPDVFRFPSTLVVDGNTNPGYAKVRAEIDTSGKVMELVCLEASKVEFANEAIRAFKDAQFIPMTDENGEPIAIRADFNIRFTYNDGIAAISFSDHIENLMDSALQTATLVQKVSPRQLDEPLRRIDQSIPVVAVDAEGAPIEGYATINFFIDHNGQPRMPTVVEASNERVGEAACETVLAWRFNQLRSNGKPCVVEVRQRIKVGS